jgi:hypothetical protein
MAGVLPRQCCGLLPAPLLLLRVCLQLLLGALSHHLCAVARTLLRLLLLQLHAPPGSLRLLQAQHR